MNHTFMAGSLFLVSGLELQRAPYASASRRHSRARARSTHAVSMYKT